MVFDRITLIQAYDVLKLTQDNDGNVRNILLNRSSKYGTKTVPRFPDLESLRVFINENYPYVVSNACNCPTKNEGMWNILAFEVYARPVDLERDLIEENNKRRDIKTQPVSRYVTFVNNMRKAYESQKANHQNALSVSKTDQLFKNDTELKRLFDTYVCLPYIESQGNYVDPCLYIEIIKNESYDKVIENYYKSTRRRDFPTQVVLF